MEMDREENRDAARDVVAMVEAAWRLQTGPGPDLFRQAENLELLLDNADRLVCLKLSVGMLASSWTLLAMLRSDMRGTTPEHEFERVLASFRRYLA